MYLQKLLKHLLIRLKMLAMLGMSLNAMIGAVVCWLVKGEGRVACEQCLQSVRALQFCVGW